jgi:ATP phosphoribosyltransferase regulatory subunit
MTLLPGGLYGLLPPHAAHERWVNGKLLKQFDKFGYYQVSPPYLEFESTLLAGQAGKAFTSQTFRVMDAYSQDMMGMRPDMTLQVGRIAMSRLNDAPRPLRLS